MIDRTSLAHDSPLPPNITGTVITVGTFDGVHRGHLDVIARLVNRSQETRLPSVLVSFDPHPLEVVNPTAAPALLTTVDEKLEVIAETGVNYFVVLPFTHRLAALSAEEFVGEVLRDRFRMRELLIGYDHGLGHRRAGNVNVLKSLGESSGFRVSVIDPVSLGDGQHVSSTAIRRAVAGGDLDRAREGLGRPYAVGGRVVRGQGRGRELGFATVNVEPPTQRKLVPPEGVYAVCVQTPRGEFGGMMNLGPRPTFGESERTLEAHLFGSPGDLYGSRVRIDFVSFLRDTRKFASAEELARQLETDRNDAMRALTLTSTAGNLNGWSRTTNNTSAVA
jgi:riboflavin kinase / FMN adenylyltransferase